MTSGLSGTGPILCAPILRQVDQHLIPLLRALAPAEWDLPTVASRWQVRDVAAHLLDTALRRLSMGRDRCRLEHVDLRSPQDLVDLVNNLNRKGVTVYRRLSPPVLIDLMELACLQAADFYESLDPFSTTPIGVSWAGETSSLVWFDIARELTERWHHQQQIRLSTNRHGIATPLLYHPVLDTFLRGLPYTFRRVEAPAGAAVLVEITGDCGGRWCLVRSSQHWAFSSDLPPSIAAHIAIPQSVAWRIFTRGICREDAFSHVSIAGDHALAEHVLRLTAIVA